MNKLAHGRHSTSFVYHMIKYSIPNIEANESILQKEGFCFTAIIIQKVHHQEGR